MRKTLLRTLFFLGVLFAVKGCIPVEDFGEYWEKGIIDPALEGHWKQLDVEFRSEQNYLSFVKSGDHYVCEVSAAFFMPQDMPQVGIRAKTLTAGKYKFLMFDLQQYYEDMKTAMSKAASEMGEDVDELTLQQMLQMPKTTVKGVLQRYSLEEGTLSIYMLDEAVLAEQIKSGNVKGRLPAQGAMMEAALSKLDGESIQFLARLADEPKYWKQVVRYGQVDDLKKAMEEARKYPATEQTPKNTLVNIDLPDLKYFAEDKTQILLRHLQASPEWKVFIEGQRMVCHRRVKQNGLWNAPEDALEMGFLDEYSKSEDIWFPIDDEDRAAPMNERNWQQMKYLFRFEEEPFGYHAVWAKEGHVMKVGPLEVQMNIKLKASDQGIESYVAIGQPGLWFEVFEQTWHEQRKKTRNALQLLKEFLKEVRAAEDEINKVGYASKLIPPGYVKKGKPTLELKWDRGAYRGQAWVNPGQQGHVYLRVFNADTKKYLSQRLIGSPLKEYIGFSKNPTTLFLHKCQLYIRASQFEQSFNAGFELWFHPDDGAPDRKLISVTDKILSDNERTIDTTRSGQVIDKSGQPIRDARVVLYGANDSGKVRFLPFECKVLETTMTNENGIFTITMKRPYRGGGPSFDRLFIVAQKDGFSLGAQYFRSLEVGKDKAIVLSKSATVSGKVVDDRGFALNGAEVHIYPIIREWEDGQLIGLLSSTDLSTSIADRDGIFMFDHIPIEAFVELYAFAEGYLDKFTWDYRGGRTDQGKFEAGAPDIVLKMEINSGFTGRVIDKDTGLPVKELEISFEPQVPDKRLVLPSVTTVTNEEGCYSMYCSPGKYLFDYAYPYETVGREIIVTKGQMVNNVDLQVYKTGTLNIKISKKGTGKPVTDADVILRNEKTGERLSAQTGEEGIAFFRRPAGRYAIERISKYGKELLSKPVPVIIQPGEREEREFKFDITAESKGILLVVTDAEKKPVSGVDIYMLPGNVHLGQTDEAGQSKIVKENYEEAVVAAFGRENLGRYGVHNEFYIYAQDTENNRAKFLNFYARSSGLIRIVLSDAFDIVGRVVDTTGQPIKGAVVYPCLVLLLPANVQKPFEMGNEDDFVTDSDGIYRLRALPHDMLGSRHTSGPYIITAAADGFGQSIVKVYTGKGSSGYIENWKRNRRSHEKRGENMPIAVEPGTTEVEIRDFVLKDAGLSLSGIVVDTLGRPMAKAKVSFTDVVDFSSSAVQTGPNAHFEPFETGPDGKFAFEDLSQGKLKFSVESEWSPGCFPGAYEFHDFDTQVEAGTENMRIVMTPKKPVAEKPKGPFGGNGLIEVLVTDSDTRSPVAGAGIAFQGEDIIFRAGVPTNIDGLAYIVLPAGEYTLSRIWGGKNYEYEQINMQVEVKAGQTHALHIEINRKHKDGIDGTVFDPNGRPAGGALLEMIPFDMEGYHSRTIGNGKFSILYAPMDMRHSGATGPVCLIIIHRRRKLAASYKPKSGYEKDVEIILKPAIRISGKVIDKEGVPTQATIKVIPYDKRYKNDGEEFGQVSSNAQGLYEILIPADLPPDYTYKLSFWANGTAEQFYSLDEIEKKPGEIVIKDVVIRGTVSRPRLLRRVR
ncbi:MAG: carboxypeptidase regulatory-like domain-containing protein [Planctomycetes bacterium]|nr:carboxypeptidase regulatory-like domain-containing protein [Planctomycetota bacterium]